MARDEHGTYQRHIGLSPDETRYVRRQPRLTAVGCGWWHVTESTKLRASAAMSSPKRAADKCHRIDLCGARH